MKYARIPRHIGIIPDGNRRWARARGLPPQDGYQAGIEPGLRMMQMCRDIGVEEISVYGFTKENVRRASDQVAAFRDACVNFSRCAVERGAALRAVGDADSDVFPAELRPYARDRSSGNIKVNLLVNYSWQWDLYHALKQRDGNGKLTYKSAARKLASSDVPALDLVLRWGGRQRLSGFLPFQSAYADFFMIDTLWPDMNLDEFIESLEWYQTQDITRGG